MEKAFHIKPTKTQTGVFIGTLLASIGISLAVEAVKKLTGKGAPRRFTVRPKQSVQQYSKILNTLKPQFHKNIPLNNHDLINWCQYLNIHPCFVK